MSARTQRLLLPALTAPVLLGLWYLVCFLLSPDRRIFLPAPHQILHALVASRAELFPALLNTGAGALAGFLLAVAVSILCALLL
jgi:NitT/TauT family transport system permease protein